jgi:hypothetical protein
MAKTSEYEIGNIIKTTEVPKVRNKSDKYSPIVAAVNDLAPGQSIFITIKDKKKASSVRNTVRDLINKAIGEKITRPA